MVGVLAYQHILPETCFGKGGSTNMHLTFACMIWVHMFFLGLSLRKLARTIHLVTHKPYSLTGEPLGRVEDEGSWTTPKAGMGGEALNVPQCSQCLWGCVQLPGEYVQEWVCACFGGQISIWLISFAPSRATFVRQRVANDENPGCQILIVKLTTLSSHHGEDEMIR